MPCGVGLSEGAGSLVAGDPSAVAAGSVVELDGDVADDADDAVGDGESLVNAPDGLDDGLADDPAGEAPLAAAEAGDAAGAVTPGADGEFARLVFLGLPAVSVTAAVAMPPRTTNAAAAVSAIVAAPPLRRCDGLYDLDMVELLGKSGPQYRRPCPPAAQEYRR
ncbi:MAG TPA: hypothetical protein VGM12_21415 [Trebonia sp.]